MSTIKANKLEHISTSNGGIQLDNSGHVTIDGQQLPTAGALSNRNLIINGAMQVAQRGTSTTSTGYLIDRYNINFGQASITQSQQSLSSGSPYDEGFRYFHRSAVTSTSSANDTYLQIEHRVEAQNLAGSGWKYKDSSTNVVASFWVRSSLAGTYYVQYRAIDTASGLFYINKSFTLVADTWTKVEHVIPGHSSLVFDDDTGNGLQITIVVHYGTDFTDSGVSVGSWFTRSGQNYLPDFTQNFTNTSSATFDLTGLQLEVGEKATPFEHRSYADELQRCKRYFQKFGTGAHFIRGATNTVYSNAPLQSFYTLPVAMRATPSGKNADGSTTVTAQGYTNAFATTPGTHEYTPNIKNGTGTMVLGLTYQSANNSSTNLPTSVAFVELSDTIYLSAEL